MSTERAAAALDEQDEFDRRDQILEAANQCFTQLGIQRTSVQDVARMAGVLGPCGHVGGVTDRGVVHAQVVADGADHHEPGVEPHPQLQPVGAEAGVRRPVLQRAADVVQHAGGIGLVVDRVEREEHVEASVVVDRRDVLLRERDVGQAVRRRF